MTITDEDRAAAASVAVLPEMRELIRAGKADHHAEPFAAHRQAAFNAGLERAAVIAASTNANFYGSAAEAYHTIIDAIRAEKEKP